MSANIRTWQERGDGWQCAAAVQIGHMQAEIDELRAALESRQEGLSDNQVQAAVMAYFQAGKRGVGVFDAMRLAILAAAPHPPAVKEAAPMHPAPARTTSDVAYDSLSPERRKKFDADMLVMEQQMQDHRRSRERRKLSVPVEVEQRVADRRGKIG